MTHSVRNVFSVFLSQIKSTYISSYFSHSFDRPLPYRRMLQVGACPLPVTRPYRKYIMSEALKCNDAQRDGRRTLRVCVSVLLTGATTQIPQVDTFFLHMLNPLYTTPPPPSHVLCCHLTYSTPCTLLQSKASKNVFGGSRQTSPVYST